MGTGAVKEGPLSHREFIRRSGRAGLGVLALMIGGRALLPGQGGATERNGSGVREIHLEARELTWELAPGKVIKAMAYNGQIPGPEIRLMGGGHVVAYDTTTINGKAYPVTQTLMVRREERVRLRLLNASSDHTHVIRLAGHPLQVTHTDGNPLVEPVQVDAVPIAPSERHDVLFVADRPGAYFLHCAEHGHAEAGEQVLVVYEGHEEAKPEAPAEDVADLKLWHYRLGQGREVLSHPSGQERTFDLSLSGGLMGSDAWTINGKQYPDTDPLRLRKGDRVRMRLSNLSMEAHPMHLHGQSFKVLAVNDQQLRRSIVKDSVDVEAHMGSVNLEFTAHNLGDWFFHCHKPMHMEGGMITLAKVE